MIMSLRRSWGVFVVAFGIGSSLGCGGSVAPTEPTPTRSAGEPPASPAPGTSSGNPSPAQPAAASPSTILGDYGYESPPGEYAAATAKVSATSASYDFRCMEGESGPILPDASGAFTAHGTLTTSGGRTETLKDVTFSGTATADALTLTVTWPTTITTSTGSKPSTDTFGPVTLTRGLVPTRWPGCI